MYLPSEHPAITRHFVSLGDRQVHFRVAGSGPVLLLLHQSPTSSAEMVTEIEAFARYFSVIGVDTPGCGLSDPLPDEQPDVTRYAEALDEFVAALGLDRFLIYGFHTGAIIGFEYARLYPDKCTAAVINGLAVFEGDELDDLLEHYNVVAEPTPDGGHLNWIWARLRDQRLFFPWYRREPEARMASNLSDGRALHPYMLDFLRARDGGRKPYQAAFAYPARQRMPDIRVPVYLVNIEFDPLAPHPERLDGFPDNVERRVFSDALLMRDKMLEFLLCHAVGDGDVARRSVGRCSTLFRNDVVNTVAGPVFVRVSNPGPDGAVVILHDAGSSSRSWESIAAQLVHDSAEQLQVVLIDSPGHGETCATHLPDFSAISISILLEKVIRETGLTNIDIIAEGAGCVIAAEIANAYPESVDRLVLIDPWLFNAAECEELIAEFVPDLSAGNYGQHHSVAWYFARDGELFWPWYAPCVANALKRVPEIEPDQLHVRVVDVLKSSGTLKQFVADLLRTDFSASLSALPMPVFCCARAGGAHEERARAAATKTQYGTYNTLSSDRKLWAGEIARMLKILH